MPGLSTESLGCPNPHHTMGGNQSFALPGEQPSIIPTADAYSRSMSKTHLKGNPVNIVADIPAIGSTIPEFTLVGTDLSEVTQSDYQGQWLLLNIFPSLDTGVCANSVRKFNERAGNLENTVVLNISKDLPFAQARFFETEGIEGARAASAFRSTFGEDYGVQLADSPMKGLLARTVVVANPEGEVTYTQLVNEITTEPDYDHVMEHLGA